MNKTVLEKNIQAAITLTDMLATSLGPKGMDKMLIDNIGDVNVTNDGFTIIDKIEIKHPIAKLIAETSKTLDKEVGDGTTSTVLLTGELLKQALKLLKEGIHPTIIIDGYKKALNESLNALKEESLNNTDNNTLKKLVITSLSGKMTDKEELTKIILFAVTDTIIENILIIKKTGQGMNNTKVINGIVIDKEPVHPRMPTSLINPRILITKTPLEIEKTETSMELRITRPEQLQNFLKQEHEKITRITESIIKSGTKIVLAQKGISEKAQEILARAGIIGIRRIREKDIDSIIKATGARLIDDLNNINEKELGTAGKVYTEKIGDEKLTIISDCPKKIKTIIIRASTKQALDEIERCINDALGVVKTIRSDNSYVPGAGLIEIILYKKIKDKGKGKEKLVFEAYAKSLLKITESLIKNSGMKISELMPELISTQKGISTEGKPINPIENGIIEPLRLKQQVITSATETAIMILKIDEILKGK